MARIPADRARSTAPSLREQLAEAPAYLKASAPAHIAEAIGAVLAPGGWEHLRATDTSLDEGKKNLALNIPTSLRDEIRAAHAADASKMSLTARVNEGFTAYLEGRFEPVRRAGHVYLEGRFDPESGKTEPRVNMNVTASALLQRQVKEKVQRSQPDKRKGPAWVAVEWLMSEYGLGAYAEGARPVLAKGTQRNFQVPARIRDLIRKLSAASGDRVDDIINEGWQAFLDGSFVPQPVTWLEADRAEMGWLAVHPNDELFERVQAACKGRAGLTALYGPSRVAIDYLLDQLGIDPQAPAEDIPAE